MYRLLRLFDGVADAVERLGQSKLSAMPDNRSLIFSRSSSNREGRARRFGPGRKSANRAQRDVPRRDDIFFLLRPGASASTLIPLAAEPAPGKVGGSRTASAVSSQCKPTAFMPAFFNSVWPICSPYKKASNVRPVKDFLGAIRLIGAVQ